MSKSRQYPRENYNYRYTKGSAYDKMADWEKVRTHKKKQSNGHVCLGQYVIVNIYRDFSTNAIGGKVMSLTRYFNKSGSKCTDIVIRVDCCDKPDNTNTNEHISHIENKKIQTEYPLINESSLFEIQEKLKYCFLNNISIIKVKIVNPEQYKEIIEIIKNFPGFDYEIKEKYISIKNLLNTSEIELNKELNNILKLNIYCFKKIKNLKLQEVNEFILLINNLKRKSLILEAVINKAIENPTFNKQISQKNIVGYKLVVQEIPFLLNKETELMRQVFEYANILEYTNKLEGVELIITQIPSTKFNLTKIKKFTSDNLEKLSNDIRKVNFSKDIIFLSTIHSIYNSLIKISLGMELIK